MIKREYWDLKLLKSENERYKKQTARVTQMPKDYQTAYQEITSYLMNNYGGFDGLDAMEAIVQLIDSFDEVIAEGLSAAEFTGNDTEKFAKEFMFATNLPNWSDKQNEKAKNKLNKKVMKKLKGQD